jgi:hypothetical protein
MPTLDRPDNLRRVLGNLACVKGKVDFATYAMVDEDDIDSQKVCADYNVRYFLDHRGWFAPRTNQLFALTDEPWVFLGTDDIRFPNCWLDTMFRLKQPSWKVIAPDDGHNPAGTNFLVERAYVLEQGGHWGTPGLVFHDGYKHNFSDSELIEVADKRGVFGRVMEVCVEQRHPLWGNADDDATYQRARAKYATDEALFERRQHLWA